MSSVTFSGRPPTNTVRQPGGRSRVVGGGTLGLGGKRVQEGVEMSSFMGRRHCGLLLFDVSAFIKFDCCDC